MEGDKIVLRELLTYICKQEGLVEKPLYFKRVGKGGAVCNYIGKRVISIAIDLERIAFGSAYVLCHELAHQIQIEREGDATHGRKFKKEEDRLVKLYANCKIARRLIW